MHAIFNKEAPLPESVDMYLVVIFLAQFHHKFQVSREMPASEMTALQAVIDVDSERKELEALAEELACCDDDG